MERGTNLDVTSQNGLEKLAVFKEEYLKRCGQEGIFIVDGKMSSSGDTFKMDGSWLDLQKIHIIIMSLFDNESNFHS